jgi:hypothetical protein
LNRCPTARRHHAVAAASPAAAVLVVVESVLGFAALGGGSGEARGVEGRSGAGADGGRSSIRAWCWLVACCCC